MNNDNNNSSKQPSPELNKLLVELKTTISTIKELYQTIDKRALEEGFSIDEIYEIANVTDTPIATKTIKSSTATEVEEEVIKTTTNNKINNQNEENKYFQRYFQHFQ